MELFWPFLQTSSDKVVKVNQVVATILTTKDIHESSVNQLKRLALVHCINFDKTNSSALWHIALLYLANAMLCETMRSGNLRDPECWFYFMLCMTGYENMWYVMGSPAPGRFDILSQSLWFLSNEYAYTNFSPVRHVISFSVPISSRCLAIHLGNVHMYRIDRDLRSAFRTSCF